MSIGATANELYTNTNFISCSEKSKQPNWSNDYTNSLMYTVHIKIVKLCFQRSVYDYVHNEHIISTTFGMKVVQTKGICIHAIKIFVAQLVFLDISKRNVKDSNLFSPNINLSIKKILKKNQFYLTFCAYFGQSHT